MSFDSVNLHIMEKFEEEDSDRPQFCEGERREEIEHFQIIKGRS